MAFQARQANYKALKRLNLNERMQAATDVNMGQTLISMLTPTQAAELFPKYYLDRHPDISGFIKAIPSSLSAARQRSYEEQIENTAAGAGSNFNSHSYKRKWRDDINEQRTQVSRRGERPPPQLSPEQRKAFDDLKAGNIGIDDERMKWLKNVPDDVKKQVGISIIKDDKGNSVYHYEAPLVSDEEVKKSLSSTSSPAIENIKSEIAKGEGDYNAYNRGVAGDTPATARTHTLTNLTVGQVMQMQAGGRGSREFFAVGKYQFIPETLRAAVRYTKVDPNAKFDAATQEKLFSYLISAEKRPVLNSYLTGKSNNREAALNDLAHEFASVPMTSGASAYGGLAGNAAMGGKARAEKLMNMLEQARNTYNDPITRDWTKEQFEERKNVLASQEEMSRMGTLARITQPNGPENAAGPIPQYKGEVPKQFGKNQQCASLSKHFAPNIGAASTWQFHDDVGAIQPGAVIATTSYGPNGHGGHPGGIEANKTWDGKSHYHTGIALTKPNDQGEVLILEQFNGQPPRVHKVNINDYNGEKMRVVMGGEPSERSMQAVSIGRSIAPEHTQAWINSDTNVGPQVSQTEKRTNLPDSENKRNTRHDRDNTAATHIKSLKEMTQKDGPENAAGKKEEKKPEPEAPKPTVEAKKEKAPEAPKTPAPEPQKEAKKEPATPVKALAEGGTVPVNTDQIKAYPINDLKGDNTVVVNAQQKPLFTMNTDENISIDGESKKATVTPEKKSTNIAAGAKQDTPTEMMQEFQSTIQDIKSDFASLKAKKTEPTQMATGTPLVDQPNWLDTLTHGSSNPFKSPSAARVAARAQGRETGSAEIGYHHNRGNNS
jgi:hypothetical protein